MKFGTSFALLAAAAATAPSVFGKTMVSTLGQSGKFTIYDDEYEGRSDPARITVEADRVCEFPKPNGNAYCSETMANQDFTMTGPTDTVYAGVGGVNITASLVTFTVPLSFGDFQFDTYVFEEAGTVLGEDGNEYPVKENDVKFNIVLSNWDYSASAEYVDVSLIVKGKADEPEEEGGQGSNTFDMGANVDLILSGNVKIGDTVEAMPAGYPKFTKTGNKYTFDFRFPKFTDTLIYDPVAGFSNADRSSSGSSSMCFSKDATVQVQGTQKPVSMADLQVGDKVLSAGNKYQTVYSFGHVNEDATAEFLQIYTQGKQPLEMTGNHLVFKNGEEAVRADTIQVGDRLSWGAVVSKISTVQKQGLYMPLTADGTIYVNGVLASSYVSITEEAPKAIGTAKGYIATEQNLLHWWLAPFRMMCMGVSSNFCTGNNTNEEGILNWLAFGRDMAEFVNKQSSFVQHMVAVPVFLVFGFAVLMEMIFGSTFAPSALLLGGAGLVYRYQQRQHRASSMDVVKKVA